MGSAELNKQYRRLALLKVALEASDADRNLLINTLTLIDSRNYESWGQAELVEHLVSLMDEGLVGYEDQDIIQLALELADLAMDELHLQGSEGVQDDNELADNAKTIIREWVDEAKKLES